MNFTLFRSTNLLDVAKLPSTWFDEVERLDFILAFRWQDGELADDMHIIMVDPFEGSDDIYVEIDGQQYVAQVLMQTIWQVLSYAHNQRSSATEYELELAVRYYMEFDAYYENSTNQFGGKWNWGNRNFKPDKREPTAFHRVWPASKPP